MAHVGDDGGDCLEMGVKSPGPVQYGHLGVQSWVEVLLSLALCDGRAAFWVVYLEVCGHIVISSRMLDGSGLYCAPTPWRTLTWFCFCCFPAGFSFTMLFNILNFPAGVLPVTTVSAEDEEELKHYKGYYNDLWDKEVIQVSASRDLPHNPLTITQCEGGGHIPLTPQPHPTD